MPSRYNRNKPEKKKSKLPTLSLADRQPHEVVGTSEWLQNKPYYIPPPPSGKKQSVVPAHAITANQYTIKMIKACLDRYGWQMIDGGDCDKCWITTKIYPKKLFQPGMIRDIETGERVLFPIAIGDEDKRGVAFHFERGAAGNYEVKTNQWYSIAADTRRGRRATKRSIAAALRQEKFAQKRQPPQEKENMTHIKKLGFKAPAPSAPVVPNRLSLEISEK